MWQKGDKIISLRHIEGKMVGEVQGLWRTRVLFGHVWDAIWSTKFRRRISSGTHKPGRGGNFWVGYINLIVFIIKIALKLNKITYKISMVREDTPGLSLRTFQLSVLVRKSKRIQQKR